MKAGRAESASRRDAGTVTLMELMAVILIIGIVAVMTAPAARFMRQQSEQLGKGQASSWELLRARAALTADVRRAGAVRTEKDSAIHLTLPGGGRVVWRSTEEGLTRRASGAGALSRTFTRVRFVSARTARANLLEATLATSSGEQQRLAVWLRMAGR